MNNMSQTPLTRISSIIDLSCMNNKLLQRANVNRFALCLINGFDEVRVQPFAEREQDDKLC